VSRTRGYYAYGVAKATPGCAAAKSKSIFVSPQTEPLCPDTGTGRKCIVIIHYDFSDAAECNRRGFTPADGDYCRGRTTEGPVTDGWGSNNTDFKWTRHNEPGRDVVYQSSPTPPSTRLNHVARIEGFDPSPASADFRVRKAVSQQYGDARTFYTPDQKGVRAGADGGPLYLNFETVPEIGAKIYIWGTLYRKN